MKRGGRLTKTSYADDAGIKVKVVRNLLERTNLHIQTGGSGRAGKNGQWGDIKVETDIIALANSVGTLKMTAHRDIYVKRNIDLRNSNGGVTLIAKRNLQVWGGKSIRTKNRLISIQDADLTLGGSLISGGGQIQIRTRSVGGITL